MIKSEIDDSGYITTPLMVVDQPNENNVCYDKEEFEKALMDPKILIVGNINNSNRSMLQMADLRFGKVVLDKQDLINQFLTLPISREQQMIEELTNSINQISSEFIEIYSKSTRSLTSIYFRQLIIKIPRMIGYKDNKKRKKRMIKKRYK